MLEYVIWITIQLIIRDVCLVALTGILDCLENDIGNSNIRKAFEHQDFMALVAEIRLSDATYVKLSIAAEVDRRTFRSFPHLLLLSIYICSFNIESSMSSIQHILARTR